MFKPVWGNGPDITKVNDFNFITKQTYLSWTYSDEKSIIKLQHEVG